MPLETSAEAAHVQTEMHRALRGPRRLQIACQMSETLPALEFVPSILISTSRQLATGLPGNCMASGETVDDVIRRIIDFLGAASIPGNYPNSGTRPRHCLHRELGREAWAPGTVGPGESKGKLTTEQRNR